jgi:two-component system phosphate regulon sensor histidine kinase PhoR
MTSKVFVRLFGLFVVLLVLYTLVVEFAFHGFVQHPSASTLRVLGGEALWAGLIALAVAIPLAAFI